MGTKWRVIKSYKNGKTETNRRVCEITNGLITICITNGHIYYPGQWTMHCNRLSINTYLLKNAKTEKEAKEMAIAVVGKTLQELYQNMLEIAETLDKVNIQGEA